MNKLLLLLSLPLVLFGCSKDRNYDGVVTISDYGLAFKGFFIVIGEVPVALFNSIKDTGFGRFFELRTIYPSEDALFATGSITLFILMILINLTSYFRDEYSQAKEIKLYEKREKAEFEQLLKDIEKDKDEQEK